MTATIKSARKDESDKGHVEINGQFYQRWLVTVQNGSEEISTDILRQPNSPDPTGQEAEQKPNGRWRVLSQGGGGGSGGGAKDFKADPVKLRAENRRSALHAAVSRANGIGPDIKGNQIVQMAELFYAYIEDGS